MSELAEVLRMNTKILTTLGKQIKALEDDYVDAYAGRVKFEKRLKDLERLLLIYSECLLNSDSIPLKSQAKLRVYIEEMSGKGEIE